MLATFRKNFMFQRKRIAHKLQNPRIERITFHTLGHLYGIMEYHKNKEIPCVEESLGHRSITSTQVYVQLLQGHGKEEYLCKVATSLEEAQTLIESGFEYVTSVQIGQTVYKMFRKKKPWQPN